MCDLHDLPIVLWPSKTGSWNEKLLSYYDDDGNGCNGKNEGEDDDGNNNNNNNNNNVKAKVTPVITGATGTISTSPRQHLSNITGKHEFKKLQKGEEDDDDDDDDNNNNNNNTYLLTYSMEQSTSWKANWFCS